MHDEGRSRGDWSLRIATVIGVPIRIHFTFLFVLIWFGVFASRKGSHPVLAVVFILLLFGCVVLHELGHAAMARRFGVRTQDIVLYPIGGVARLENMPGGKAELFIALAGPAVNLAIALLLLPLVLLAGGPFFIERLRTPGDLLNALFVVNLVMLFFNLLPAFPMDGGRVLRALLSLRMSQDRATDIAAAVGQTGAVLFAAAGVLFGDPILILIAAFVFFGAAQETLIHRRMAMMRGRSAREAMIVRFETLSPQDSLGSAAQRLLATHQQDFPVIDAWNRVAGMLPRSVLLQALAQHGPTVAVLEVMEREVQTVAPDEDLAQVLEQLRHRPGSPVMVLDGERMMGMITLENLAEFVEISKRSSAGSQSR